MSAVTVRKPCPHCGQEIDAVVQVDENEGYGETRFKCPHCKGRVKATHTRSWRR